VLRLEVFHHLFAACAEEMGAALQRSAFSANIKERRDFSCALLDGTGRMVSQAAHIPIHLGSVPLSVAAVLSEHSLQRGDAVVLNDPFRGGTHLPDVTLVSPVFLPGRRRPDFLVANRAHHADVGGAVPGSMAPAADVHGEGLRIPPVKLVRRGELDHDTVVGIGPLGEHNQHVGRVAVQRKRCVMPDPGTQADRCASRHAKDFYSIHGYARTGRRGLGDVDQDVVVQGQDDLAH